jgi:hypothetical protein
MSSEQYVNLSKKNLNSNICSNPVLSLFDIFIAANSKLEFDTGLTQPGEEDNVSTPQAKF